MFIRAFFFCEGKKICRIQIFFHLFSCDNDKFKAKIALRAMGYTDSAEGSTQRDTTQGRESLTKHTYSTEMSRDTTQRDHIPTKHTYTAVPAKEERQTSPQRETISEDEKKRSMSIIKKKYHIFTISQMHASSLLVITQVQSIVISYLLIKIRKYMSDILH